MLVIFWVCLMINLVMHNSKFKTLLFFRERKNVNILNKAAVYRKPKSNINRLTKAEADKES